MSTLGMPTTKPCYATPSCPNCGWPLLVKVGGMAFKRAAFLLRRCKSADDVVKNAGRFGFKVQKVADTSALRTAVARENEALAEHFEEMVACAFPGRTQRRRWVLSRCLSPP